MDDGPDNVVLIVVAREPSGSGIGIVLAGGLVMVLHQSLRLLVGYAPLAPAAVIASTFTPFTILLIERSTGYQSDESLSSRAFKPYSLPYLAWIENLPRMLLGYGPGSSQCIVAGTSVVALSVPSPARAFFEYGIVSV